MNYFITVHNTGRVKYHFEVIVWHEEEMSLENTD